MKTVIHPVVKTTTNALRASIKEILRWISRPQSERRYIPELDGLRFVAIMMVVIQHLSERLFRIQPGSIQQSWEHNPLHYAVSRGSIGVLLFFAISGFILSLPFWNESKPIAYRGYLRGRLLRIEPPYLIWMCVWALVLLLTGRFAAGDLGPHLLASLLYSHTLGYGEFSVINPVAWSLEIEIQFYLLAPLFVYLLRRYFKPEPRFWIIPTLILAYTALMHAMGWQHGLLKFTLLGQLPYFFMGLWIGDQYQQGRIAEKRSPWAMLILPFWIVMMYTWSEEFLKTIVFLVALGGFFTLSLRPSLFRDILRNPWVAAIGGMCYTIYLVHLPLLEGFSKLTQGWFVHPNYLVSMLVHGVMWVLPVLMFSIAGYLFFEKPFMNRNWPSIFMQFLKSGLKPVSRANASTIITVLTIGGTFFVGRATAQTDTLTWQGRVVAPLPVLIERATQNAILLKETDRQIEIYAVDRDLTRKQWLQHFSLAGGTDAGNGNYLSTSNDGFRAVNSSSNRQTVQFAVGVNVQIPFTAFTSRKDEIKKQTLIMEKEMLHKSGQIQSIKQEVIVRYTQFKEALRLLELQSAAKEASTLQLTVAEKYFKEAQMSVEEYGRAMEQHFQARMELERRKSSAEMAYHLLNIIVGESIN